MMLHLVKRLVEVHAWVETGLWRRRETAPMGDISGSTVLVVGLGRVGARVAKFCDALGMTVLARDPSPWHVPDYVELVELAGGAGPSRRRAPLRATRPVDRRMINEATLSQARKGMILVNSSRGGLVQIDPLVVALDAGHIAGFGTDVFPEEPPPATSPLFGRRNVILSPHCSRSPRSPNGRCSSPRPTRPTHSSTAGFPRASSTNPAVWSAQPVRLTGPDQRGRGQIAGR